MKAWTIPVAIAPALLFLLPGGCGSASSSGSGASGSGGAVTFSTPTSNVTVGNPYAVAASDFNLDGKPDLLAPGLSGNSIGYHRNTTTTGVATASFAAYVSLGTGAEPRACDIADLNGDGRPDAVVCNAASNTVSILENNTSPGAAAISFAAPVNIALANTPQGVVLTDINGDGKPDMAVARTAADTLTVFTNSTTPGSAPIFDGTVDSFGTGLKPVAVAAGDLNNDGKPDLVTANMGDALAATPVAGSVTVFINTYAAAGNNQADFTAGVSFAAGYTTVAVAMTDLNLDGLLDLAVSNYDSDTISFFINKTTPGATAPSFAAAVHYATRARPWGLVCRDFNGDGRMDVAVATAGSSSFSVFVNSTAPGASAPTFSARVDVGTGTGPNGIAAADFNGDGRPDVAVSNYNSSTLTVHLNTTAMGASSVDFASAVNVNQATPRAVALRDINGSGHADLVVAAAGTSDDAEVRLNETAAGAGSPTFGSVENFGVGDEPLSLAFGDFNADGKPDLITADASGNTLTILQNGTAFPPASPPIPAPAFSIAASLATDPSPRSVVAADLNGDGKPDLAAACATNDTVSVFLRDASGWPGTANFLARLDLGVGDSPVSICAADFNRDGRIDLAAAHAGDHTVKILRNETAPGGSPAVFTDVDTIALPAGSQPSAMAAADLNGDGYPDLVVALASTSKACVLTNRTPGQITQPPPVTLPIAFDDAVLSELFDTGLTPLGLAIADLNRDGKPDLAVANSGDGTISMLLNETTPGSSAPAFASKVDFAAGSGARAVAIGDINRDGKPDVAAANENGGTVSLLMAE